MDSVQFALFFVALLVGYALVHLRLSRFEEHLQKLAALPRLDDRLRLLDERLQGLAEGFRQLKFDRLEAQLDRLHDDLEDLKEISVGVRQAVVEIPPPAPAAGGAAAAAPVETPAARVLGLVETRLLQLGYGEIQVLSDLRALPPEGEVELQVECVRGGMPCKGRVVVRNGAVRDVAIQTVATMFP